MEQPHSASADGPPRTSLSTAAGASIRCVLPLESPAGQPDAVIVLREDAVLCALPEDVQLQLAAAPRCTPYPEAPSGAEPGKGPKRRKLHGSREDVFAPLAVRAAALIPPESLSLSARLRVQQAAQEHDWQNEERLAEQSSAADAAALPPLLVSETQKRSTASEDLVHRLVFNASAGATVLPIGSAKCEPTTKHMILPPSSGFLVTDLLRSQLHLPRGLQGVLEYARVKPPSLLLLDPPYPNRSATRLNDQRLRRCQQAKPDGRTRPEAYAPTADLFDLWALKTPITALLALAEPDEAPLVACWVTNDPKAQHFLLHKLFPACDLAYIGEIAWLKVVAPCSVAATCDHDPQPAATQLLVSPEALGRKPYELLFLARHVAPGSQTQAEQVAPAFVASVPLGHSRKPYMLDVLRPLLPPLHRRSPRVIEFFARNLCATREDSAATASTASESASLADDGYWLSLGNEACKFNVLGEGLARDASKECHG